MADYKYFATLNNRFDLNLLRRSGDVFPFSAIADLRYECWPIQHDLKPFRFYRVPSGFDSDSYTGFLKVNGLFDIRGMQFEAIRQAFDAISYHCGESFRFDYDFLIRQKNGVAQIFDAIDNWVAPRQTGFSWRHDLVVAVRDKHCGLFEAHPLFRVDLARIGQDSYNRRNRVVYAK